MKTAIKGLLALTLLAWILPGAAAPASHARTQVWEYPVIQHHGGVVPLPKAALQPDSLNTYKVVFNLTANADSDKVNSGLQHVARAVNVFALSGVKPDHRKFVVVIHGPATDIVTKNDAYRRRTGKDNPNVDLIHALRSAGVKLYVCGQALAEHHIAHAEVNPEVTLSLSALSDIIILEHKGYALYPL